MTRKTIWTSMAAILVVIGASTFFALDYYSNMISKEVVNTILKSEASAVQQGNLISSFTKLQSAIQTSESLRGIAIFDMKSNSGISLPLISMGDLPDLESPDFSNKHSRKGIFDRLFVRHLNDKVLVFYFEFKFLKWIFVLLLGITATFLAIVVYLGRQFEQVRANERAELLVSISQQISHDIKSPLSALKVVSGVLRNKGVSTGLLEAGIQRIEEIIDDLNVKSGIFKTIYQDHQEFNFSECVELVVSEKINQYPNYEIAFANSPTIFASGLPKQVKRVLSNLLNNAIEASRPGGKIEVKLDVVQDKSVLTIKDYGQGISNLSKKQLFKRGYTEGKANGSGLGLFHAKEVISAMGGKISLESEVDIGTKVFVELPLLRLVSTLVENSDAHLNLTKLDGIF